MKKKGMPSNGEIVIAQIKKIYPNSAYAELVEYNGSGMIHASEVARRWVKNIREFVKENQYVVCKVMAVDERGALLSIKRVFKEQINSRLNEFKRETKAEKLLERAAKDLNISLEEAFDEIAPILLEEFGSLSKTFEVAGKNRELFLSKNIPSKWAEAIIETARKSMVEKTFEVKAHMELTCYDPNGVEIIKKALSLAGKEGLAVKYISAPNYLIEGKGKKFKELRAKVEKAAEDIAREVEKHNGECDFRIEE